MYLYSMLLAEVARKERVYLTSAERHRALNASRTPRRTGPAGWRRARKARVEVRPFAIRAKEAC